MHDHDPDARRRAALIADVRTALHDLGLLLGSASAAQWQAPPIARPREDTTERAQGGHADPTARIALDERRLALREAVQRAETLLSQANQALAAHRERLARALADWESGM